MNLTHMSGCTDYLTLEKKKKKSLEPFCPRFKSPISKVMNLWFIQKIIHDF